MAVTARSKPRITVSKRHSWPKSRVHHLESIPESPRSPPRKSFAFESEPRPPRRTRTVDETPAANSIDAEVDETLPEAIRTQMKWYDYQLDQSYRDRESLATKVSDLEIVCKSQMNINASLQEEVQTWRQNYEIIDAELLEAAEEINEARTSLRQLKTANLNLRYTLCQLKEEQELAEQRMLCRRVKSYWGRCLNWSQSILPAGLRIGLRKRSGGRPPARQGFNNESRSVAAKTQVDGDTPQPTKMKIPSPKQRPLCRQLARPLSSHPPKQACLDNPAEEKVSK